MYLHLLRATSSFSAASPVFLALPFPSQLVLASASPLTPFAFGSPSVLAVWEGREENIRRRRKKG